MASEESTVQSGAKCGACGHVSDKEAKFCAGCGQSLIEPCGECGKPVLLTQKFCAVCGCNLEDLLQKRLDEVQQWMGTAVRHAKIYEYDEAISFLNRACKIQDYRFCQLVDQAKLASKKVRALRDDALATVHATTQKAKQAIDEDNKADAARMLQQIPEKLRDEEVKNLLTRCINFLGQESALVTDLQKSIRDKDWITAGNLLQQAIELSPEEHQYLKLGKQVTEKLYTLSEKLDKKCDYDTAVQCLDSVPNKFRSGEHDELRSRREGLLWISRQFAGEPFATATLGRLAVRFSKDAPHDESAKRLIKELSERVREKAVSPRSPWAAWRGRRESVFGGELEMLGYPMSVSFEADSSVRKTPGRFNVALGLAMQGLGLGRLKDNFIEPKGLLSGFRKKAKAVWGIDLGTASLKAVLVAANGDGELVVMQSYHRSFDQPTCRAGTKFSSIVETYRDALEAMKEELEIGDEPIWVNLPANELVTRFAVLPPLADKQAATMLNNEAEQKIPLPLEELNLVKWICPNYEESGRGRPSAVSAAKKASIEKRVELFEDAELKVAGMQSDTLALVTFADVEFGQLWESPEEEGDTKQKSKAVDEDESSTDNAEPDTKEYLKQSLVLVDAGASSTKLIVVSGEAFWFWTVEAGGELLTSALVGSTKLVAGEAEERKFNPALLEAPSSNLEPVFRRQDELRGRLEKILAEAMAYHEHFEVLQTWCFGGACLTHAWIRKVMLR